MQVKSGWRTGALLVAALLAGSIVGPPLVHAATADLVTIQGSDSTHQVAVTQAGQLEETSIAPESEVTVFQFPSCAAGGIYTVPAGKALIITGVTFYNSAVTTSTPVEIDLLIGPSATPCTSVMAAGIDSDNRLSVHQDFQPGIPVPAGDAVGGVADNNSGSMEFYGYLVPKADVPASTIRQAPKSTIRTNR
jgi:hypothetical protein